MPLTNCKEIQAKLLERLKKQDKGFCDGRCIAILLGAGCNIGAVQGCEFPQWSNLLKKLSWDGEEIDSSRYLEVAGHIETCFLESNRERVRDLFRDLAVLPTRQAIDSIARPDTTQKMAKYVKIALLSGMTNLKDDLTPGSTMAYVRDICLKRIEEKLRTVIITYNYDDLFECKLKEALRSLYDGGTRMYSDDDIQRIVRSASGTLPGAANLICNGNDGPSVDIFYVHGKISIFDEEEETISDRIILSQQSYEVLSRNHLEAANQIQYVVQTGMPIVSIGFSFDDFNFCRLRREILSNYGQLPPFYSLQYCNSNSKVCNVLRCAKKRKRSMTAQLNHIDMLNINALPVPKNKLREYLEIIFNMKFKEN